MWDNFQTYLACRQLPEMSTGNYTHTKESSTEEVPLEDCSVGEWIFQGNWRLSTLDLGHVHGDHSTFSASRLYYKNSRWRIGCQEEAILLKMFHFPLIMSHLATNFDPTIIPGKMLYLLTSVLFRLVVRPCWWLFRAILSFFLRRSSVLTFSPRGIQSSMLFSSTGLAFNWVRIQEVSSVTLKTSKTWFTSLPFHNSRTDVRFSVIATNGEVATGCEPDSSGRQVSNCNRGKIAVLYEENWPYE